MVRALLEKVIAKRGGSLPLMMMVIGDEPSDDRMFDVRIHTYACLLTLVSLLLPPYDRLCIT